MRTFDENTKRKKRQDIGKISVIRYRKGMKTAQVTHYAVSLASVSVVYDWNDECHEFWGFSLSIEAPKWARSS